MPPRTDPSAAYRPTGPEARVLVAAKIIPLKRPHRPGAHLPDVLICNRRCLVCDTYGCVIRLLTPEHRGGKATGDNLLPVCAKCAKIPDSALFRFMRVAQWIVDHDRLDIVMDMGFSPG